MKSNAAISDSLHVKHYTITVSELNIPSHTLKANCRVIFESKHNFVHQLKLELLHLTIDSILVNGLNKSYLYNDSLISIPLSNPLGAGDTTVADIYYQGSPVQDASGWGGFYFQGAYAFNMGVGFASEPHNYGKAWFPCIDEFTDKSYYDFYITTSPTQKAFCNGVLVDSISNGNTITWHWKMIQPIPTYLASIALANYYTLQRTSNNVPVEWACQPSDTNAILNTFQHLDTVLSSFITAYGPYPFEKAGYALVPFNSGAMEHATSIHIGSAYMNGLTYETLWAHELSHMWWGDKVTCENASEMWLNEGFASFNEAFMTEKVYGKTAYKNWIRTNHKRVLQFAHIDDGNYLSLNNVPHAHTYGTTVYKKGADVIHTLRNYMSDTAFFSGCRYYMNTRGFSTATSLQFQNDLTTSSGINMTRFFNDWIFTEGFPHFSIDSVIYIPGGLDHYFVYVRQRSKGNNHIYSMPVEINFTDGITDTSVTVLIDSATQSFHIPLVMVAQMISIDRNEKISDAITDFEKWITSTGSITFNETNASVNTVSIGTDSTLIRIENNWVRPDGWKQSNPGIRISDYHYWKVDGIIKPGYDGTFTFIYNGSNSNNNGYIDNSLITGDEDSLVLLYRKSVADDWQIVSNVIQTTGISTTDKVGTMKTDSVMIGEYTFGYRDITSGINNHKSNSIYDLTAMPNPSPDTFTLLINTDLIKNTVVRIFDQSGKVVMERKVNKQENRIQWNAENQQPGIYIAELIVNGEKVKSILLSHINK